MQWLRQMSTSTKILLIFLAVAGVFFVLMLYLLIKTGALPSLDIFNQQAQLTLTENSDYKLIAKNSDRLLELFKSSQSNTGGTTKVDKIEVKLVNEPQKKFRSDWVPDKNSNEKIEVMSSDYVLNGTTLIINIYQNFTDPKVIANGEDDIEKRQLRATYDVIQNICSVASIVANTSVARENTCVEDNWNNKIDEYRDNPLVMLIKR